MEIKTTKILHFLIAIDQLKGFLIKNVVYIIRIF